MTNSHISKLIALPGARTSPEVALAALVLDDTARQIARGELGEIVKERE